MKDLYWDTSPVAREDREQLRRENERLREALRDLLAWDYESDVDPGPIFQRARDALARYREASDG